MAVQTTVARRRIARRGAAPSSRHITAHARGNAAIYSFAMGIAGTIVSIDFVMSFVGLTIGNHDLPPLILAIMFGPIIFLASGLFSGIVGLSSQWRPLAIIGLVSNALALVMVPVFFTFGAVFAQ